MKQVSQHTAQTKIGSPDSNLHGYDTTPYDIMAMLNYVNGLLYSSENQEAFLMSASKEFHE